MNKNDITDALRVDPTLRAELIRDAAFRSLLGLAPAAAAPSDAFRRVAHGTPPSGLLGYDHAAPELWETRADPAEDPPAFIRRVYGPTLEAGLTRADLRRIDPKLYRALAGWLRSNELPDGLHLPTHRQRNDALLAAHGIDPNSPEGLRLIWRLLAVVQRRIQEADPSRSRARRAKPAKDAAKPAETRHPGP